MSISGINVEVEDVGCGETITGALQLMPAFRADTRRCVRGCVEFETTTVEQGEQLIGETLFAWAREGKGGNAFSTETVH